MADHQGTRSATELTTLDAFLDEEGIGEELTLHAVNRVLAMQLEQAMQERKLSKSAMAALMDTSRA
jgi:antitoxin HicB